MLPQNASPYARFASAAALAASLAITGANAPAQAAQAQPGSIVFTNDIQLSQKPMPLFRLTRLAPPVELIRRAVGSTRISLDQPSRMGFRDKLGNLRAYADLKTGEAQVLPTFRSTGAAANRQAVLSAAAALFGRSDVLPKDATSVRLGEATRIFSASASRASNGRSVLESAPQVLFTYVPVVRYAANREVFGIGSHATVGIGNDGSIQAFARRWRAAVQVGEIAPAVSREQLISAIARQLDSVRSGDSAITVDRVTPAYYDGDGSYIQPVYAFEATVHALGGPTSDEHARGYVPIGKVVEPIPSLAQIAQGPPRTQAITPAAGQNGSDVSQIMLGEYYNRDGQTLRQGEGYFQGFQSVTPWVYGPPINLTQSLWAYPYQVESQANSYLNAVNVAVTMPHGNWWVNSTDGHNGDLWYVKDIGTNGNPGYGQAGGGVLATWIIDSCEVIPSHYDFVAQGHNGNEAFGPWWPVFQGLHRALGFRTEMLLSNDTVDMVTQIGQLMAEGASATPAYHNTVALYSFGTYYDGHIKQTVHFDRTSTMEDPRNYNESIYQIQGQSASTNLTNVWMDN